MLKNKVNEMKLLIITLILVLSLQFYSCTLFKNNLLYEGYYRIVAIDTGTFKNYNSLFISDRNEVSYWLLSKKIGDSDLYYRNNEKYRVISENSVEYLNIAKLDTLKIIKSKIGRTSNNVTLIYDDKKENPIWRNDTILVDVYCSSMIIGIYVLNEKRK
jgi:hypothetical protein